ncbi:hypothetical protein FRC09_019504, partial [Ceratobasidium sp. 395]
MPTPRQQFRCLLCGTANLSPSKAQHHEDTVTHVHMVRKQARLSTEEDADKSCDPASGATASQLTGERILVDYNDAAEFNGSYDEYLHNREDFTTIPGPQLPTDPIDAIYDDYSGDLALLGGQQLTGDISELGDEARKADTPSDPPPYDDAFYNPFNVDTSAHPESPPEHSADAAPDAETWLPWTNEAVRIGPATIYELEGLIWVCQRLGVSGLSSLDQLKTVRTRITETFGSNTRPATSAAGNLFSHNSLQTMIAHEMANPVTASKLATFPEDSGEYMAGPTHGEKWRTEVDANLASPMARLHKTSGAFQDYFVNEPCLVRAGDQTAPVMVSRWFKRNGSLVANVHKLVPLEGRNGYAVDGGNCLEVPEEDFHLALPDFRRVYGEYKLPSPDHILDFWVNGNPDEAVPWTQPAENPWRRRAKGKEVISVPILGYCDDTSGNASKKWNKHNSYLFVLAGLPHEEIQSPYHVHFLATSNIASPLEMLEAIVRESEDAACEGIWAYSAVKHDLVLCIAWWLALEGDNPMQSELSSHIGMNGKYFCRVCQVRKGNREQDRDVQEEKERLHDFMNIGPLRSQEHTKECLTEQLDKFMAKQFTASDKLTTATGVKDKYLEHFIDTMKATYNRALSSKRLTTRQGQDLLTSLRSQYPERLFNPALYLPGIDVNQDTPVEVLHVVLLGITKYFWCDAVSRLDTHNRSILIARLNSFDTRGLGISRLDGRTLVQYAKSLTGGNFRTILQVAPAVLYELVDMPIYNMWTALCYLAPLVFQPEIHDVSAYMAALEARIDRLLLATVMCNPQWFNKPKFHVLLHLPNHVRRFGPPTIFATETFESYNFVIRLRSIHSNRQAPSADIGASFSLLHAMRHLVSGGYFQLPAARSKGSKPAVNAPWIQAGAGVRALAHDKIFMKFMGLSNPSEAHIPGSCVPLPLPHGRPVPWTDTLACELLSTYTITNPPDSAIRCQSVKLGDDSTLNINDFVLVRVTSGASSDQLQSGLVLAQVRKITADSTTRNVLVVSVKPFEVGPPVLPYNFPSVFPSQQHAFATSLSTIATTVSTFHDCASHQCSLTKSRQRRQERQLLDSYDDEVQHSFGLSSLVLNMAQWRSAEIIHEFYPAVSPPLPSVEEAISVGLARQKTLEDEQKAKQEAKEEKKAKRAKKAEEGSGPKSKKRKTASENKQKPKRRKTRFHPYNHRPPTNNGRQGVENPGGYLTGAPMEFPEPSSGGPAAGWLGHDGRIAFPNDASAMRTSNIPPHTIDSIATDVQLSGDQRMALHRFTKGGAEVQQAQVHAHQLALENKITSLQDTIKDVKEATDKVSKTVTSSWTPNDFQKKTVRQLCWNYLTYDLDSYLLLWINVKESVGVNPTKVLSVPTYGTDLELTKAVDSFIRSEANNVKSRFKKAMDNEAGSQHSLTRITESTLKAHRQNWTPSSV